MPLLPSAKKEGTWLTALAGKSNAFVARFTRAILNHAPIGEYRDRFNLLEEGELLLCPECLWRETREHILNGCIWTNCRWYFVWELIPGVAKSCTLKSGFIARFKSVQCYGQLRGADAKALRLKLSDVQVAYGTVDSNIDLSAT